MSASDLPLPAHWQYYADRSRETQRGRTDDFGYGREELLWETLAVIQSGVPFTDDCRHRLDRIPHNRAKKYRRMRLFHAKRATPVGGCEVPAADTADTLDFARRLLSPSEWGIEHRLADGENYAEVARGSEVSPDALKVRVSRWRQRVRRNLATTV